MLTLEEVHERHRARIQAVLDAHGWEWTQEYLWKIPCSQWMELHEATRKDYLLMAGAEDEFGASRRRGVRAEISTRLDAFFKQYVLFVCTVKEIADTCEVAEATVYAYFRANPGCVKTVRRGLYEVCDVAADRAAAKAEPKTEKSVSLDGLLTALTGH